MNEYKSYETKNYDFYENDIKEINDIDISKNEKIKIQLFKSYTLDKYKREYHIKNNLKTSLESI